MVGAQDYGCGDDRRLKCNLLNILQIRQKRYGGNRLFAAVAGTRFPGKR